MRAVPPICAVVVTVAVAGCSGSSGGSTSATTAPPVVTPSAVPTTSPSPSETPTPPPPSSAPAIAPSASATTSPSTAATCTTVSLRLTTGRGGAAAGTSYVPLVFTNTSSTPCALLGFPGVSFLDAKGKQIGLPASRSAGEPKRRVVLAPGDKAHALLGLPDTANYSDSDCRPQQASAVRVYPPDQTDSLTVGMRVTICTTTSGRALVQPIRPGTSG